MGTINSKPKSSYDKIIEEQELMEKKETHEKTPEEIENEQKEFNNKFLHAIIFYNKLKREREFNKDFKIKLPILSICDIPVNVFMIFTHVKNNIGIDSYKIDLIIYPKNDSEKILYNKTISNYEYLNFSKIYKDKNYHHEISKINIILNRIKQIISELNIDSYVECFTKMIIDYENDSNFFENIPHVTIEPINLCKNCNKQIKHNDLLCYFCKIKTA